MMLHRYVYGRPVEPDEFLDRDGALRTLFNRLRNAESTAIVGEPHIGKTSLLRKLADTDTQYGYMGEEAKGCWFNLIDLHPIEDCYTPRKFWEEALEPVLAHPGHASVTSRLKECADSHYSRRSLRRLFDRLAERGVRLVLLLDEFERLFTSGLNSTLKIT
jgi:hypothetical protein